MRMKITRRTVGALIFLFTATYASGAPIDISNDVLKAVYDNGTLSLFVKDDKTPFLQEVVLGNADAKQTVSLLTVHDPCWGRGKAVKLLEPSGDSCTASLFKSLPFVMLQRTLVNSSANERKVNKADVLAGRISLDCPLDELATVSTAGLKPLTNDPAGYVCMSIAEPVSRNGVVCGWLTSERGSGIVFADDKEGPPMLRARIDYGDLRIAAGKSAVTEILLVGYFNDVRNGLADYADAVAKQLDITLPPMPTVYCTWYHARASDEKKIAANTDFTADKLKPYDFHVMQIDDGWQDGYSVNGPRKNFTKIKEDGPYGGGMKKTADYIRSQGFVPGVWFMPFCGSWYDDFWKDKQDLFLMQGESKDNYLKESIKKRKNISPPNGPENKWPYAVRWGGTCLDMTNPKSQDYLRDVVNRIAHKWGYKYFKMDGLWTGTGTRIQYVNDAYKDDDLGQQKRYNPAITPIEAYAKGLELVRVTAGEDVFLLGCCQPQNMRSFGPSMGRLDAMRVGPDNGANAGSLTRGPTYSSRLFFLNKRVWYNDPDPVYVRVGFPVPMAQTSVSWTALTGSLHSSSYQYGDLPQDRLDILRKSIPSHGLKTVVPVDYLENDPPKLWHLKDDRENVRKDVIGLFNWDVKLRQTITCTLDRVQLPAAKTYVGFDFWTNQFLPTFSDKIEVTLPPGGCSIVSLRPASPNPQVVSASRHLTQGVISLKKEKWSALSKTLSGASAVIGHDPYELRIIVPTGDRSWLVNKANLDQAPKGAAISYVQNGPMIRAIINSPKNAEIKWTLSFKRGSVQSPADNPVNSNKVK